MRKAFIIAALAIVSPQAAMAGASLGGDVIFKPDSNVRFLGESVDFSQTTVTGLDTGAPCAKNVNGPCKVDTSTTKNRYKTVNNTTNNYYGSDAMPPALRSLPLSEDEGTELRTASTAETASEATTSGSTSFNSGGNNSTNNNSTSNTFLDMPEIPVAPLPMGDNIGTIGDVSVPLPAVSVGAFASRKPYEIEDYSTSGDYDYGVSAGFNIPL